MSTQIRGSVDIKAGSTTFDRMIAMTAGSVVFAGASGVLTQDNANLFWDDTNNRLGIGTPAPDAPITVSANTTAPVAGATGTLAHFLNADGVATRVLVDIFGNIGALDFRRANGTAAAPTAIAANEALGLVVGRGYYVTGGPAYSGGQARIGMFAAEAWTSTALGTYLTFSTTPIGGTALTDRVWIDAAGNMGIGATPTYKLDVVGDIRIPNTAFYWANDSAGNARAVVGYSAGTNVFQIRNGAASGRIDIGADTTPTIVLAGSGGNVGVGLTGPTAVLHIKAGTATANTAPLKINPGTNLTAPELGAIELTDNGTTGHLYVTLNVAGVLTRVQIV